MSRNGLRSAERPRLGISACLLGDRVRYNGGHKRESFLSDVLGSCVEWVRVCPEVEVGMGTPREPVHLVSGSDGRVRMLTTRTRIDHTASMTNWAGERLDALSREGLSGYVLKKDSPSCGMAGVKLYSAGGASSRNGRGLFAAALLARFPDLPVTEEGHLSDPRLREHFVERVFAYWRLCRLFERQWTPEALAAFHTVHEMQLHAHSPAACAELGRLAASASRLSPRTVRDRYVRGFMQALAAVAGRQRHAAVLTRMTRLLGKGLERDARGELLTSIDEYRRARVPLRVPVMLLRQRASGQPYLAAQAYLSPYPDGLQLRDAV